MDVRRGSDDGHGDEPFVSVKQRLGSASRRRAVSLNEAAVRAVESEWTFGAVATTDTETSRDSQ